MNNPTEWYQRLQLYRNVPPRRTTVFSSNKPECYALSVRNAQFSNLKIGVLYRVHIYFFDKLQQYFFGRPYCSEWYRSVANSVLFNEVTFFWSSFHDGIFVVLELVEREEAGQHFNLYTAAWTAIPLGGTGNPVADYSSSSHELFFYRQSLHFGSPKALFSLGVELEKTGFWKSNGNLEIGLQTYQKMLGVLNFISCWHIVGHREDIPELRMLSDSNLHPLQTHACILTQIKVSFGTDASSFEQILLHLLNNDRLYRANRSPADISVKPMVVLERRITIGVHNGLRYVGEPQCLHLIPSESQLTGIQNTKWNYKLITRSCSDLRPHFRSLYLNGSVVLNGAMFDPHFAVVFTLDYLVGVYSQDGTTYSSQSVMVGWAAWCPFTADRKSDDQNIVPLVGGSGINPNERLSFRNMIAFWPGSPFEEQLPRIRIAFAFSEVKENIQQAAAAFPRSGFELLERSESTSTSTEIVPPKSRKKRHEAKSLQSLLLTGEKYSEEKISSVQKPDIDIEVETHSLPTTWTANTSRASLAILTQILFSAIKDRSGNEPKFVDIERIEAPDVKIELNDKLDTNETIVQYMGIAFSSTENGSIKTPTSLFFTMHFYRFQMVTTERLLLDAIHTKSSSQEQLYILKRTASSGESCNGFTVKYTIDRNSLPDGEEDDYINYLSSGHLVIDVWDADSLLPLGTSRVPLNYLLRHGSEAVQANVQSKVVLGCFPEKPTAACQVLLRLANIGHPSTKQIDLTRSRTSAVVSHRLTRAGQNEIESYRIRAKPLNPIHENALQRFITAQRLDINQRYDEIMDRTSMMSAKGGDSINSSITTKGSVKRYLFQQELEAYKKLRSEDKASKLLKTVFKAITTQHRTFPKYGQITFFEFLLQNTEPEGTVIIVDTAQSTLRPLFDVALWQYYKDVYRIETPLVTDLYSVSEKNGRIAEVYIFLKPMETVYAPFIYDGFALPQEQIHNEVKAVFKKKDGGEPIAILDLLVEIRRNVVENSFRFYHEAETALSRVIRIAGYRDKTRVRAVRCADPLVLFSLKSNPDGSQDLQFTCQTGKAPSVRTFTVIFFADKYYDDALGTWIIHIHAVNRINVNSVRAQLTKVPIVLKADGDDQLVLLSSLSRNLKIYPSEVELQRGNILSVVASFTQNFAGVQTMLICAIDQRTKRLLSQWMIVANVQEANITKMFEVYLESDKVQTTKLMVGNRYGIERSFRISCSHPEYVRIENDVVVLAGCKVADVPVTFLPIRKPNLSEVLIFVTNMENNLQEEAYSLKLIYND